MRKVRISYNNQCLKCNKVEVEMLVIGNLYFCQRCFDFEFGLSKLGDSDCFPEVQESKYLKWAKDYAKQCQREANEAIKDI